MNHKPFPTGVAIAVLLAALSASPLLAAPPQDQRAAQQATKLRRSLFSVINYNFKPMGDVLKRAPEPSTALVLDRTQRLEIMVPMIAELFATDTRGFQVDTWASDRIWSDPQGFRAKTAAFGEAVSRLRAAAAGGDRKAVLGEIAKVASACKACHNDYIRE